MLSQSVSCWWTRKQGQPTVRTGTEGSILKFTDGSGRVLLEVELPPDAKGIYGSLPGPYFLDTYPSDRPIDQVKVRGTP